MDGEASAAHRLHYLEARSARPENFNAPFAHASLAHETWCIQSGRLCASKDNIAAQTYELQSREGPSRVEKDLMTSVREHAASLSPQD